MADTTDTSTTTQTQTGSESSLSNWAGPYVTDMLGKGWGLSEQPYQAYTGPLTAGQSQLQNQAFGGVAGLALPQNMGAFQPKSFTDQNVAQQYMNPYVQQAIQPQLDELRRQAAISRNQTMGQLSKAGAYGGSRSTLADAELTRGMLANMAGITGKGYSDAYNAAMQQFNAEQARGQTAQDAANTYGLAALQKQAEMGAAQRAIEQEGVAADKAQFEEERDFPYKQVQYMQSLLQGLPIAAQSYSYQQPSALSQFLSNTSTYGGLLDSLLESFGE
jgi:hypothetical protein